MDRRAFFRTSVPVVAAVMDLPVAAALPAPTPVFFMDVSGPTQLDYQQFMAAWIAYALVPETKLAGMFEYDETNHIKIKPICKKHSPSSSLPNFQSWPQSISMG